MILGVVAPLAFALRRKLPGQAYATAEATLISAQGLLACHRGLWPSRRGRDAGLDAFGRRGVTDRIRLLGGSAGMGAAIVAWVGPAMHSLDPVLAIRRIDFTLGGEPCVRSEPGGPSRAVP